MKILVITMQFPQFPAPGGQTRQFCLLREAAKAHEITLVTSAFPPSDAAYAELKGLLHDVIVVERKFPMMPQPDPSLLGFKPLLGELRKNVPFEVDKWMQQKEVTKFLSNLAETDFDLIQVEHSEIAHWVDDIFPKHPKLLVLHNVNFLIYKRFYEIAPMFTKEKIWSFFQWRNMRKYEQTLAFKFNKFIAMSDNDKNLFLEIAPDADVAVVPNGVDIDYFSPGKANDEENSVVYTGYMGWKPSIDAVVTFYNEIFPILRRSFPDLKFYIVGKDPSEEVMALAKDDNVIVTGFVDDVRPYIKKSKLVVVPLRVGGGTRLKILEAMSMGKVVVSTRIGAEGLLVSNGIDIFLEDEPDRFAEKCRQVLLDESLRITMGKKARDKALSYSWEQIGSSLLATYKQFEVGQS